MSDQPQNPPETDPDTPPAETSDDEFALDADLVQAILDAVEAGDQEGACTLCDGLHIADLADLVEQISSEARRAWVGLIWTDLDPELIIELEEGIRDEVLAILEPAEVAQTARELETDDLVYLVEDLEADQQAAILEALDPEDRIAVAKSLEYPEYSAGRLMQADFVKAPAFWTVGQMIDALRADEDLPEQFYDIIIVDPALRPVGKIPLAAILGNRRPVTLESLMETDFRTLRVDDPQEDVAYAFNQYHLVSAPVVDEDGRVVGVITIDDAMEVLEDEAEEDLKRLGGVGDEEISDRIWAITKRRFPWLAVNLITAILASFVITICSMVASKTA
ncbi:MAG: CBS domain-containing protein, partial [Pseudomonadota bacterium]